VLCPLQELDALLDLEPGSALLPLEKGTTVQNEGLVRESRDKTPCKLFQARSEYGVLVKLNADLVQQGCREYMMLSGFSGNWLQDAETMTIPVVHDMLMRVSSPTRDSQCAEICSRVAGSDRHPSNLGGERFLIKDRGAR
jgi:hypothetical protein